MTQIMKNPELIGYSSAIAEYELLFPVEIEPLGFSTYFFQKQKNLAIHPEFFQAVPLDAEDQIIQNNVTNFFFFKIPKNFEFYSVAILKC